MGWFAVQLIWYLLAAFLIGLLSGWLLWARGRRAPSSSGERAASAEASRLRAELLRTRAQLEAARAASTGTEATDGSAAAPAMPAMPAVVAVVAAQAMPAGTARRSGAPRRAGDEAAASVPQPVGSGADHVDGMAAGDVVIDLRDAATASGATDSAAPTGGSLHGDAPAAPDELERITGIDTRIAGALRAAGIDSFVRLVNSDDERLRDALAPTGLGIPPGLGTWRRQAAYLVRGDEPGFAAYSSRLVAGRSPAPTTSGASRR